MVEECLAIAVQAPSGSNRQTWQWMLVDDAVKKERLAELYAQAFDALLQTPASAANADDDRRTERQQRLVDSSRYLRDNLHRVPVMLLAYVEGRPERLPAGSHPGFWGSIIPAVWSFMLALRARGLGSVWTTLTCRREREVGELLGVPDGEYTQVGLFPVAYTIGTDFKPAPRIDVADRIHWNSW